MFVFSSNKYTSASLLLFFFSCELTILFPKWIRQEIDQTSATDVDISTLTLFGGRFHADFFVVHFELVLRGVGGGAVPIGHLLVPELADLGADVTVLLAPFPLPLAELLDLAIFSDLSTD